ncbi:MAG TPA: ABC transporter permease, partial [Candidatus Limnocylindrales bacterium]
MIPRRFRNWILFWTPVAWLVLELVKYPKTVYWADGLGAMLKGFFSSTVANYPAWILVLAAVAVLAVGILGLVRKNKAVAFNYLLIVIGLVFAVWAFLAGGGVSGWSASADAISYDWVLQTVVVVLAGVAAYFWARGNPERAELLTWNTHQVWRLYRGNWQGMLGLCILLFFIFMALFAPFLISHGLLDPNAQITGADGQLLGPYHPPTFSWQNLFGTDQVGQSVLAQFIWSARISLIVGLLAAVGSTVVGAGIGIMAGFYGGWQSEVWMRLTDAFLVIPWLPLAMVLAAAWGQNFFMIIIIIGITSWPGTARVVRSDVLRVRELQFIERARAIGS